MPINQPSNQIKLTNVSIVRLKKGGKRFEIACYKNKVQEYRTGVETNLDDVLQIGHVFTNVSKGEQAKVGDLKKAFGKANEDEIIKMILKEGDLQVGEKEREHELTNMRREILNKVAESVVDPATQRLYSAAIIDKAMTQAGFSVKPDKPVKAQVLECIRLLQEHASLPIQRARMCIRVILSTTRRIPDSMKEKVHKEADKIVESTERPDTWETVLHIDPGKFRVLKDLLSAEWPNGRIEIEEHAVTTGNVES
ncbi:Shwachman-Bodian-diamond syndrome protein [Schizopora paradoxa]|uniref:Shwachman-Bodian-diamond syndrome protein n=1 Tax=Schizopora paradoxa TaxID=27342 RepID=A0A0H2S2Q6_9AGAM|nr:Shwachman-Bodian-diamond syndrome protein [Schizopora paradoxa]